MDGSEGGVKGVTEQVNQAYTQEDIQYNLKQSQSIWCNTTYHLFAHHVRKYTGEMNYIDLYETYITSPLVSDSLHIFDPYFNIQ